MDVRDFLRITPHINDCPNCANQYIGNGQGSLEVDNNLIKRTCKCGFKFEYDVTEGVSKKKIKQAIEKSLNQLHLSKEG
ncbi:DUF3797 domain-containing protein [Streptomyces sp. SID8380]|nr:DUF3797 domain-containing protein [Streptomyces sp. SID8380]